MDGSVVSEGKGGAAFQGNCLSEEAFSGSQALSTPLSVLPFPTASVLSAPHSAGAMEQALRLPVPLLNACAPGTGRSWGLGAQQPWQGSLAALRHSLPALGRLLFSGAWLWGGWLWQGWLGSPTPQMHPRHPWRRTQLNHLVPGRQ